MMAACNHHVLAAIMVGECVGEALFRVRAARKGADVADAALMQLARLAHAAAGAHGCAGQQRRTATWLTTLERAEIRAARFSGTALRNAAALYGSYRRRKLACKGEAAVESQPLFWPNDRIYVYLKQADCTKGVRVCSASFCSPPSKV